MGNVLYIDCFSGISGDMMIGALLDIGLDLKYLQSELKKIDLAGYSLEVKDVKVNGVHAKKAEIIVEGEQPLRDYSDIKSILSKSGISDNSKNMALEIFEELAKAESKVHDVDISSVHFHEIGAVDSIIDISSTAVGLDSLCIEKIYSRPVPLGKGFTESMHGKIPVPAPATLEIAKGIEVYGGGFDFEVTTPTGMAIIKVLSEGVSDFPDMVPEAVGFGAGNKKSEKLPNVLRIVKGRQTGKGYGRTDRTIIKLSTNIDDMAPEIAAPLFKRFEEIGALDFWMENIYMKKNRPALQINLLCEINDIERFSEEIFKNTTTFGIRIEEIRRLELEREIKKVKMPYGEARIKLGYYQGKLVTCSPEFEDCVKLQEKTGKTLKEIYRDVVFSFQQNSI